MDAALEREKKDRREEWKEGGGEEREESGGLELKMGGRSA